VRPPRDWQLTGKLEWLHQYRILIALILLVVSSVACAKVFGFYTGDSPRYLLLANNIAGGNGFSASPAPPYHPEVFRPPLYPHFLGLIFNLGLGIYGAALAQVALYFAAITLAEKICLAVTGNRLAALGALFLLSVYLPIIRWMVAITTESLCAILFCLFCYSFLKVIESPGWPNVLVNALSLSGLFLTRQPYLVLLPLAVCLVYWLRRGKDGKSYLIVMALIPAIVAGAWSWRNLNVMPGVFQPLGIGSGMTLFVGAVELQERDIAKRDDWIWSDPDFHTVHKGSDVLALVEADRNLRQAGLSVIRERKWDYFKRVVYLTLFRQWIELFDPKLPGALAILAPAPSGLMLAFACAGLIIVRRNRRIAFSLALFCFVVAGAHAIFVLEARYTAPVRPVLYGFACLTFARLVEKRFGLNGAGETF